MSYSIGDIVRIGTGKVEYQVDSFPADGKAFVIGEKSSRTVDTARLVLVKAAEVPVETFADVMDRVDAYTDGEDAFDPRTDRRQSAYGLAILAAVLRKNPRAGAHNVNPLKPVGSKRAKVRKRVKNTRTQVRKLSEAYNTVRRQNGWDIAA